jgi:hypothetical protein
MKSRILMVVAAATTLLASRNNTYSWFADASTSGSTTQLFLNVSTPAPTGTVIWFVADLGLNGINPSPTFMEISHIKAGVGDDVLLYSDTLDGSRPGNHPGQYQRNGIQVTDTVAYSNANIWVYLWNVSSAVTGMASAAAVGMAGQIFAVTNLGVCTVPSVGNAVWSIGAPVFVSIPEPSTLLLAGLGLAGVVAMQRHKHT